MDPFIPQSHPIVRRLESITTLSAEERDAIAAVPLIVRDLKADNDIIREGDRPSQCCLIIDGFLCRYKIVSDGKRQIMGFYIKGDIPDLLSLHIDVMDHSVGTLAASKVAFIQHEHIRELIRRYPGIGDAFWRDTLIDAAVFREWMVGMGRRDTKARIAHLLCELVVKYRAVGLTTNYEIQLPLTQSEIADALGVSTVHANRVTQDLRAQNLISWFGQKLAVLNWKGLKEAGDFDPAYLHLKNSAAA